MTKEDAVKILQEEKRHSEIHLQDAGKAPEFFKEMQEFVDACELAIMALEMIGNAINRDALLVKLACVCTATAGGIFEEAQQSYINAFRKLVESEPPICGKEEKYYLKIKDFEKAKPGDVVGLLVDKPEDIGRYAISRDAALKVLDIMRNAYNGEEFDIDDITELGRSEMMALTPVNTEARVGHWEPTRKTIAISDEMRDIYLRLPVGKCSICGETIPKIGQFRNFCSLCGAYLKEGLV